MIQANNITLSFGGQEIFKDISFTVSEDQRVGLVGRNGSGKSTLLKAIAEDGVLDSGKISVLNGKRIAYMPQDVILASQKSILDETLSAFGKAYQLKTEAEQLEVQLDKGASADVIEQYSIVQAELAEHDFDKYVAETEKMLLGLGFKKEQFGNPVSSLSVGWKMRVVLAKLLLQNADFYLFDEPTNHLDLVAKEWFLDFLKQSSFGFLIVCHERYFLDELCDYILELELGNGKMFTGNYSDYLVQKEKDLKLLEAAYENQQKEIKRKEATIERFRYKTSKARMAQSMIKALEKIDRIVLPSSQKDIHFSFAPTHKAARVVLKVKNAAKSFGDKQVFKNVSFEVERGQRIAIVAANGVGKSTLFNMIIDSHYGKPVPEGQSGDVQFGANVHAAIFAQDQNKALNLDQDIITNIQDLCSSKPEQLVRKFLGSFLFNSDDVKKKVKVLSGGEKNRVGMVSVLLQDANLLLLDEPTNHLDIPSKEILLKALQAYDGTMLFVSHDRSFINDLATHIIELTPNGAYLYHGNYDSFVAQKEMAGQKDTAKADAPKSKKSSSPKPVDQERFKNLKKEVGQAERLISQIESRLEKALASFDGLTYGTDKFAENDKRVKKLKVELALAEQEWELLMAKLSTLETDV